MTGFMFNLERNDGTPVDPPTFRSVVPNWRKGDTIHLAHRMLRVIETRLDEGTEGDPVHVLVVEDAA